MLDELIYIKIKKLVEKEYNRFIILNGTIMLLSVLVIGLSFLISYILIYISFPLFLIHIFIFRFNITKLRNRLNALMDRALSMREFREYLGTLYGEYAPDGLSYIKQLEGEDIRILSDLEDVEEGKARASSVLYRSMLSAAKSRILVSSLAGISSSVILLTIAPIHPIVKITIVAFLILSIYYTYKIISL
jgi:hypothetical protein